MHENFERCLVISNGRYQAVILRVCQHRVDETAWSSRHTNADGLGCKERRVPGERDMQKSTESHSLVFP